MACPACYWERKVLEQEHPGIHLSNVQKKTLDILHFQILLPIRRFSSSHSTQLLSGSTSGSHSSKETQIDWRGSRGGLWRWPKCQRPCLMRGDWKSWVFSPWRKAPGRQLRGPSQSIPAWKEQLQGGQKLSLEKETWEKKIGQQVQAVQREASSWCKNFSLWDQPFTGATSPGMWWNSHHQRFSGCDWTGCKIISSGIPFPQKVGPDDLSRSLPAWDALCFFGSVIQFVHQVL